MKNEIMNNIAPVKVSDVTQLIAFKTIWDRLPRKSFISGLWLRSYWNTPLWQNCFLNILSVRDYPYFRFYFGNIIMVTPGERGLWSQGKEEDRISYALDIEEKSRGASTANWGVVKALEEDLKFAYKKHFPSTRGIFLDYRYDLKDQIKITGELNKKFWDEFK